MHVHGKRAMALFITTCILPYLDVAINRFFAFLRKKCGGKGAGEAGEVPRKTEGLNPLSRGKPRQMPAGIPGRGSDMPPACHSLPRPRFAAP